MGAVATSVSTVDHYRPSSCKHHHRRCSLCRFIESSVSAVGRVKKLLGAKDKKVGRSRVAQTCCNTDRRTSLDLILLDISRS